MLPCARPTCSRLQNPRRKEFRHQNFLRFDLQDNAQLCPGQRTTTAISRPNKAALTRAKIGKKDLRRHNPGGHKETTKLQYRNLARTKDRSSCHAKYIHEPSTGLEFKKLLSPGCAHTEFWCCEKEPSPRENRLGEKREASSSTVEASKQASRQAEPQTILAQPSSLRNKG